MFADAANAGNPGIEFLRGIEIVVSLVGRGGGVITEPGVVAAPVEPDVADRRSSFRGRLDRSADDGLVDVAEAGIVFAEKSKGFQRLPGRVAQLYDKRVIGKAGEHGGEVRNCFARAMERKRKLQEDSAEFLRLAQNIEARTDGAFILSCGRGVVCEFLPELGGIYE